MKPQRFFIWTGGQPGNPEENRVASLPLLPDPDPLPCGALIIYWWGNVRFEIVASACSVCVTPWGDGQMTWLYCKAAQTSAITADAPTKTMATLIPAHYVSEVKLGPPYQVAERHTSGDIGLFPPNHPAPPHALPLAEIERALAGLSESPTGAGWGFSVTYPLFALKRDSGAYVGFNTTEPTPEGTSLGIPVFTTEAAAIEFRARTKTQARVMTFDRVAVFRRFLRSVRDAGTYILFDPHPGRDDRLYVDHTYPAAVVLERFLPEATWGWSYPVYVLRYGPGFACVTGDHAGTLVKVLVVFTDSDLADRAVTAATEPMTAVPVADAEAFARLVRDQPSDVVGVAFDPPDPVRGGVAKFVLFRENVLNNLENMEL